jgi:hypothetical protein
MSMPAPPTPLQIDYIDPDGNDWDLSDLSMAKGYACSAINGIEGLATSMQMVPLLDGTATADLYIPQPGVINLAILVGRPSSGLENDYYAVLDGVARAFYNRRNELPAPGYIQIQRPDGTTRQIAVFTTSGLNTPEVGISNHTIYTFSLQTPDPYWQDLVSQQLSFSTPPGSGGILPLLPVQLAGSAISSSISVTNGGNAQAWPVWTITGPGTPTMVNYRSGRQWSLNAPIPAGNIVQVVTKPGQQMAVNTTTGVNIWDQLVLGTTLSNLWSLMAGLNQIGITMAGSSPATSVGLSWVNRWNRA